MPADIIIYAIIAAGLVFWLRSVLGTRHGEERDRPNPYAASPVVEVASKPKKDDIEGETVATAQTPGARIKALFENEEESIYAINDDAAHEGLQTILKTDKAFDIDHFLKGAQDAFAMIIEAFAAGDRETLAGLLRAEVLEPFEAAITAREGEKQTQHTDVHAIRKLEVLEAGLDEAGKEARITLRFTAEETSVTRDEKGEIIAGDPDKISTMHDVWVFARPVRSKDPRWWVSETREDAHEDNELLPNSHE